MTTAAITGLEREIERARELMASLTDEEWSAASGCEGWRVQDVVQHMAAVFQQIAAPDTIETGDPSAGTEATAEVPVQARRDWSSAQVVQAYDEWAPKGLAALAALQDPPMADNVIPLGDLGHHPMHLLGDAIAFDHYCHLRHDIGAAVDRAAALPRDEMALGPAIIWMMAGLPEMCAAALADAPGRAVNIALDGEAADTWCLSPGTSDGDHWVVAHGADDDAPVVRTTAHDFVSWATKRADWRETTTGDVDDPEVAAVLDAINVI